MLGRTYSVGDDDVLILVELLRREKFILEDGQPGHFRLSIDGLLEVERMAATVRPYSQGFVAMSFSESMNEAWTEGFAPAIKAAGYRPFRIDKKDYSGGISDEMIAEIRKSRFLVADYTEQRQSVYFEAGYAMALPIPVIQTCRDIEIGKLHFDIRHINTLPWNKPRDLVDALPKRIIVVVGTGPEND
jgi:hypothetical protein